MPTAMTALGGYGVYRALKPKKRMVPKDSPNAMRVPGKEKTSSVRSDVWGAAKYVLPVTAAGTALGLGASKLSDKLIPERPDDSWVVAGSKRKARDIATSMGATAGATGLGALAGIPLLRRTGMPLKFRALLGAAGGVYGMGLPATIAAQGREMAKTPETDTLSNPLPERAQDVIRRNPWIGGVRNAALGVGLPLAGMYAFRKYYPGTFARAKGKVVDAVSEFMPKPGPL